MDQSSLSSSASREGFLDKKIQMLDRRLTQLEKFIDLRFRGNGREREAYCDNNSAYEGIGLQISRRKEGEDDDLKFPRKRQQSHVVVNLDKNSKSSRKRQQDQVVIDLDNDSKSRKRQQGTSISNSDNDSEPPRKRQQDLSSNDSKLKRKQKPGPASSKRPQDLQVASETRVKSGIVMKDCVIRITKLENLQESSNNRTPVPSSSRSRSRRSPKIYEDNNFHGREATRRRETRRMRENSQAESENDDRESVIKVERSEALPVEIIDHYSDNAGDDYMGEEAASPLCEDNDGDEKGGGYLAFPGSSSPARSVVVETKEVRKRRKRDTAHEAKEDEDLSSASSHDNSDDDWNDGGIDEDDDDHKIDEKPASRSGRKPGSKDSAPRRPYKRGKYKTVKLDAKSRGRCIKPLDVTQIPLVTSDPSLKHCQICNRHFKEEFFQKHVDSHTRERHLKCKECGKAFFNQNTLRSHMMIHEPDKHTKRCRQCSKPFLHNFKLFAHECWCVKKTLEKSGYVDPELIEDLKKNSKKDVGWVEKAIETGSRLADPKSHERKECPHCHKKFKAFFFDRHVSTHTRPRNWPCSVCDKTYLYKTDLIKHMSYEHVDSRSCDLCNKKFDDKETFASHLPACRLEYRTGITEVSVPNSSDKVAGDTNVEGSNMETKGENDEGLEHVSIE